MCTPRNYPSLRRGDRAPCAATDVGRHHHQPMNVNGSMAVADIARPLTVNGKENGYHHQEPAVEDLERMLPDVNEGQVPFGMIVSRVAQQIYAELQEVAETLPGMSDVARKRTLADFVVATKKQVVKLYAIAKWARDAETVQKCLNLVGFLMNQKYEIDSAIGRLHQIHDELNPERLGNHDLLTSLDVLTTGTYQRLPTIIKKSVIPVKPLTNPDVVSTFREVEQVMRYRLRTTEYIPIEMMQYRIAGGRVYFTVPNLFEVGVCLVGAQKDDGWFTTHFEFLIGIGGDATEVQEIPRIPTGITKAHLTLEGDRLLGLYTKISEEQIASGVPPNPNVLEEGTADAPLVRLYNFIQIMSLSYQLEILLFQAQRLQYLGWQQYMSCRMSPDRKTLSVRYWLRPRHPRNLVPPSAGTLHISIIDRRTPKGEPFRSPKARKLAEIQRKSKLGDLRPSEEVETLALEARWEPEQDALGVSLPREYVTMREGELVVDPQDLDIERLLRKCISRHTYAILSALQEQLQKGPAADIFGAPGMVTLVEESPGGASLSHDHGTTTPAHPTTITHFDSATHSHPFGPSHPSALAPKDPDTVLALRVCLCAEEVAVISIDPRTGQITIRDTGDLAAPDKGLCFAGPNRGLRFLVITERVNADPVMLFTALMKLRLMTIMEITEQKANYLGLQVYRNRNFEKGELNKLGPNWHGGLFIPLGNVPHHYLVLVMRHNDFDYALITTEDKPDSLFYGMNIIDVAWLDVNRICAGENLQMTGVGGFNINIRCLKALYNYCSARITYMTVEKQFKERHIQFKHVTVASDTHPPALTATQSILARSIPALCVESQHILSGAPAAEAAMPNIRVIPLNWWSDTRAPRVVTCVKLKYVQQPLGRRAGGTSAVIRPSKRIIYDTTHAVVSFLSEDVSKCVDEFLEEWARVSKMVVIAREVAGMSKEKNWPDVRLLSFDLQTVEFAYASDYTVSIYYQDQLTLAGGTFYLRFSREKTDSAMDDDRFNPHADAEPFMRNILQRGHGKLAPSLVRLVTLLRDTLPIVQELEEIMWQSEQKGGMAASVDTFAKAAGWYRLLYGDLRHALDFRLMSGRRVAILDGAVSLFESELPSSAPATEAEIGLVRIPQLCEMIDQVVSEISAADAKKAGSLVMVDKGIVCGVDDLGPADESPCFSHAARSVALSSGDSGGYWSFTRFKKSSTGMKWVFWVFGFPTVTYGTNPAWNGHRRILRHGGAPDRALSPRLALGNDARGCEGVERDIPHVQWELLADDSIDEQAHALHDLGQRHQGDSRVVHQLDEVLVRDASPYQDEPMDAKFGLTLRVNDRAQAGEREGSVPGKIYNLQWLVLGQDGEELLASDYGYGIIREGSSDAANRLHSILISITLRQNLGDGIDVVGCDSLRDGRIDGLSDATGGNRSPLALQAKPPLWLAGSQARHQPATQTPPDNALRLGTAGACPN
ncbi:MED14-domain-containing protein [Schizophyllum commune H4-8]|uniref:Mediator of RNA polymerase II transcription subunit 14 n=1 Tax=Schizophyllum commune (strain H4-8 / FGSC 9210) TaxID=578458 RepID=D8QB62_SCHCM|nr:MED14-domain-containing protein [Schizophyllum commune H4-8]KAI5889049.1 MED14-domain-containing protein [Schizophyllum commune H4-8]